MFPPARNSTGAANVKALVTVSAATSCRRAALDLLKPRMVHEHRAVRRRYIRTAGRDHILWLHFRVHANGFFYKNMLAQLLGFQHPLLVQFGRQRNVDRINTFVREERVVACADDAPRLDGPIDPAPARLQKACALSRDRDATATSVQRSERMMALAFLRAIEAQPMIPMPL